MIAGTIRQVRRLVVAVIGFTVLALGVALLVLPGPAFFVIPAGLGILSLEFVWARNLLRRLRRKLTGQPPADPAPPRSTGLGG